MLSKGVVQLNLFQHNPFAILASPLPIPLLPIFVSVLLPMKITQVLHPRTSEQHSVKGDSCAQWRYNTTFIIHYIFVLIPTRSSNKDIQGEKKRGKNSRKGKGSICQEVVVVVVIVWTHQENSSEKGLRLFRS